MLPEKFYIGIHKADCIGQTDVPLFVSRRILHKRKTLPRAIGPLVVDSGGFTELTINGKWTVPPKQYAEECRRFIQEIGNIPWLAIQDWMCEPVIINGGNVGFGKGKIAPGTHLSIYEHQKRTVQSYLDLMSLAPDLQWAPVLQGWEADDYLSHWEMYEAYGICIESQPIVPMGSVCRRGNVKPIIDLVRRLSTQGIKIHGFGLKTTGIRTMAQWLESSDSMAWSVEAFHKPILPECIGKHNVNAKRQNCANCLTYAIKWRERILEVIDDGNTRSTQVGLWDEDKPF